MNAPSSPGLPSLWQVAATQLRANKAGETLDDGAGFGLVQKLKALDSMLLLKKHSNQAQKLDKKIVFYDFKSYK